MQGALLQSTKKRGKVSADALAIFEKSVIWRDNRGWIFNYNIK